MVICHETSKEQYDVPRLRLTSVISSQKWG